MVKVDKDLCIGCGLCVAVAPDAFQFDDEGKAVAIVTDADAAQDAAAQCPVQAIVVE